MDGTGIGLLVQSHRRRVGLTQHDLAQRSGISVRALRDIELAQVARPRLDSLRRLASALDLTDAQTEEFFRAARLDSPDAPRQREAPDSDRRPRVDVLGPLQATRGPADLTLATAAQRGLLGLLALQPNQPVRRDEIMHALWGDDLPRTCVSQIHMAVGQLRDLLEPGRERRAPGDVIQLDHAGYALRLDAAQSDVATFGLLTAQARAQRDLGANAEAVTLLDRALRCWRGPALADGHIRLRQHPAAQVANRERLDAALLMADIAIDLRQYDLAAGQLRVLVEDEPYHEGLYARLMLCLAGSSERAAALRLFAEMRERLADELGVEPAAELRDAHLRVLRGEVPPPEARVGSLLTRPDREPVVPSLLPPGIADFTGRESQIGQVVSHLRGDADREPARAALPVVVISGMGGVGKTALAVHTAYRVASAYPDGQLFVNLRGAQPAPVDAGDVLARFLRTLGVDARAVPHDLLERTEMYRSRLAGRRVLVVLDDAASEEQVRPLLPGAAGCGVLITGRARLSGVEGAHWIDLDVFDPGNAVELLARVAGEQRISAEAGEAAEVAALCGLLPLAVRIAGARLAARPTWRLSDLVGMLGDQRQRLDRLTAGDLAVRASLGFSYHGLDGVSRRLFRLLGLFDTPDIPDFLATALLDGDADKAARHLETLVDAQLLTISTAGSPGPGHSHYRFHDLVRLYARECGEAEESEADRAAALRRGFGAWLTVAEHMALPVPGPCYAPIHGSAERYPIDLADAGLAGTDSLTWFDAERPALQSVIDQACALGLDQVAFGLAGCMEKYFDIRGMYIDWRAVNEHVMGVCRAAGNVLGEAVMLRGLIDVVTWNSTDKAGEAMVDSLADSTRLLGLFTTLDHHAGMADANVMCSWGHAAVGAYPQALAHATEALRLAEETSHIGGQARAEVALAIAHAEQGALPLAIEYLDSALAHSRTLGNPRYEGTALQFLGMAHLRIGNFGVSEQMLTDSLVISRRFRDHYTEVLTMLLLARLYLHRGDPQAAAAAEVSLTLGREYNMPHHIADSLAVLGEIELAAGHPERAIEHLEESVRVWRTRGWAAFLAAALRSLGAARSKVDAVAAAEAFDEAADDLRPVGPDRGGGRDRRAAVEAGRRYADARLTNCGSKIVEVTARPGSPICSSSNRAISAAMSSTGCRTVVSRGRLAIAARLSSNPMTATSSGTRRPWSRSTCTAPSAIRSLAANTPSSAGTSASNCSIAASPPSWVKLPSTDGTNGRPRRAIASRKPESRSAPAGVSAGPPMVTIEVQPRVTRRSAASAAPACEATSTKLIGSGDAGRANSTVAARGVDEEAGQRVASAHRDQHDPVEVARTQIGQQPVAGRRCY